MFQGAEDVNNIEQLNTLLAATYIQAYLECSPELQEGIRDMILILNDPQADEDERFGALATLAYALFPDKDRMWLGHWLEDAT